MPCNKCDKPYSAADFYSCQPTECKVCVRKRVTKHRQENLEKVREYDRSRSGLPHRKTLNKSTLRNFRNKNPATRSAQSLVAHAINDGRLTRLPCEVCGNDRSNAHHDDYVKPLDVRWLCTAHHRQWHRDNGPGLNASAIIPRRTKKVCPPSLV